jgi:FG-GAP-like repeat
MDGSYRGSASATPNYPRQSNDASPSSPTNPPSVSVPGNNNTVISGGSLGNPGPSWHALGTGDFNGDGRSDILLQNDSGEVAIWELNGTSVIGGGSIANPGPSWHAVGTGDYNGDGRSDILWQNSSGDVAVWEMNGTAVIGGAVLGSPGPTWHA